MDKILTKVTKLKQNASLLGLHSIRAFCFDATKALKLEVMDGVDGNPSLFFSLCGFLSSAYSLAIDTDMTGK